MPIHDLYCCSQECSPIRSCHITTNIVDLPTSTWADQSDACSSCSINSYDRRPHEDLASGWSERVVGTAPTVYWTRRVGIWLVSLHTSSHTALVVTWSDLIGLHSWLQRYKSRIGMTPDPSSLLRRGWPARLCQHALPINYWFHCACQRAQVNTSR